MSSNKSGSAEPSAGGKGIFIALIPWIVFTVLASHVTLKLGSLAALAAAIVIAVPGVRAGRPKLIEVGAVVTFVGFVVVAFLVDASTAHWVGRYARGIAALILSLISFASLLFTPFTEQYAREQVPEQYWGSPKFKEINRKLTTMWACIFAAMVPFHAIAGTIDTKAGNIVFNWAIPLALVYWGIKRSSAPEARDAGAEARQEDDVTVQSAMDPAGGRRAHELRALVAAARWGAADPDLVEAIAGRLPGGDFFGMGDRRGRGPCAGISLHGVRRAGPPGGTALAATGVATRLGSGARVGRRCDDPP